MNKRKAEKLDDLYVNNRDRFEQELPDLTCAEASEYEEISRHDINYYLWTYHVSYAYGALWAGIEKMTEQEKQTLLNSFDDDNQKLRPELTIPDGFDSTKKLSEYGSWHMADYK